MDVPWWNCSAKYVKKEYWKLVVKKKHLKCKKKDLGLVEKVRKQGKPN